MEHEFICRGARVRVRASGEVEVLTEPAVEYCPYVAAVYGIRHIDREAVERIVRMKMEKFGFCCPRRRFDIGLKVPFGSSEIISTCMRAGLLDCAVTVCEGAGTVIAWDPDLVQGIGAFLNGILRTYPMEPILKHIEEHGGLALAPREAKIDQPSGVEKAIEMGFKRIAVTVIGPMASDIERIRELEGEAGGVEVAIFSTCNTLVREGDVKYLLMADLVCSSASKVVREQVGPRAIAQLGIYIPVFILTELGKRLALTYLMEVGSGLVISRARLPYIVEGKQPILAEHGCCGSPSRCPQP